MSIRKSSSRKALYPMIASVLLILFVTGIGTILLSWLNSYTKDMTSETDRDSETMMSCSGAVIDISRLYILNGTSPNQTFKIVLNNIGQVSLDVKEILLMNNTGDTCSFNLSGSNTNLETGKPLTLTATDICSGFLDHNNKECSDLDLVTVYTNCESARADITYSDDPAIVCRH